MLSFIGHQSKVLLKRSFATKCDQSLFINGILMARPRTAVLDPNTWWISNINMAQYQDIRDVSVLLLGEYDKYDHFSLIKDLARKNKEVRRFHGTGSLQLGNVKLNVTSSKWFFESNSDLCALVDGNFITMKLRERSYRSDNHFIKPSL